MREAAIGRCQAKLVIGDNRDWILGVSYDTAIALWYKSDGIWCEHWFQHCDYSRTTVQHKARLVRAAHEEVGEGIDRAASCEFSVFVNGCGEWRELGVFGLAWHDAEFLDESFANCGGGRLSCRGW